MTPLIWSIDRISEFWQAVKDKIAGKQDRLTGQPGQVAGFGADGNAQAVNGWSNPNLLINWDFRNPVNRNGKAVYSANEYTIDKWISYNNNLLVNPGYITLKAGSVLTQSVPLKYVQGKQLTASFLTVDGNLYSGTGTYIQGTTLLFINNPLNQFYMMQETDSSVYFQYYDNNTDTHILAIKLELGGHQTLARQNESGEWEIIDPPNYDEQYALCSLYSPVTGKWVGYQHSNPNLLDNACWASRDAIINQRGRMEYANGGYTIDRWYVNLNGTVKITDSGLILNSTSGESYFFQHYDGVLEGKLLTFSTLLANGTFLTGTGVFPQSNGVVNLFLGDGIRAYFEKSGELYRTIVLGVSENSNVPVIAAKLELGPVQTLAHKEGDTWVLNDPPPNKALELAKCQRYYWKSNFTFASKEKFNQNYMICNVQFPVRMRITPSVTILSEQGTENMMSIWDSAADSGISAIANVSSIGQDGFSSVYTNPGMSMDKVYSFCVIADANL